MTEHHRTYEKQEWENGISPAKMSQGRRDVTKRCHCGKRRDWHTVPEANECKKTAQTDIVGSIMTERDIEKARLQKI